MQHSSVLVETERGNRPVAQDYRSIPAYLKAMADWQRQNDRSFSLRKRLLTEPGCSASLVSQVISGKRKLTRDHVEAFSRILGLTRPETRYLDQWVTLQRNGGRAARSKNILNVASKPASRTPQNHLLNHWLNTYLKDACSVEGFEADPAKLYRLFGGIVSPKQIERSLSFLLREGFLRKTIQGKLVENASVVTTTDNVPSRAIRSFHKKALDLAKRAIDTYPVDRRRASAVIVPLDAEGYEELCGILKGFYEQLLEFADKRPNTNKYLYQVLINLSPIIGGKS